MDDEFEPPQRGLQVDNNFNGKTGGEVTREMGKGAVVAVIGALIPEEKLIGLVKSCKLGDKAKKAFDAVKDAVKRGPKPKPTGPHNQTIIREANKLAKAGNDIIAGGGRAKERLIPTPGGKKTGRRPDILYKNKRGELKGRNVGKTKADGTPLPRENDALDDLNGPGSLPTDFVPYDR